MINLLALPTLEFLITIIGSLVFFALGWLHFDSWKVSKSQKSYLLRGLGFFLLSLNYLFDASRIDLLLLDLVAYQFKTAGLGLIIISLFMEPILPLPRSVKNKNYAILPTSFLSAYFLPITSFLYLIVSITYLIKSTKGLEKQIRLAFYGFFLLFVSEVISFFVLKTNTQNVFLSNLIIEYGPLWIAQHILEGLAIIILVVWTWGYLRFQTHVQLFITLVSSILIVFVLTTFTFSAVLIKNIENQTLESLKTNVNVIHFALERLHQESLANARSVADNSDLKKYFELNETDELFKTASTLMLNQGTDFLYLADINGKIILSADDIDRKSEGISDDEVYNQSLNNKPISTISKNTLSSVPQIEVRSYYPIKKVEGSEIIGVAITGFYIDNAFVDGVKDTTDLDITVFASDVRSATTLLEDGSSSRFIGTKLSDEKVLDKVLTEKESFTGRTRIFNRPFLAAYSPLKSYGDEVVGMIAVAKHEQELLSAVDNTLDQTFILSVILMVASIGPAYYLSRYIEKHIQA